LRLKRGISTIWGLAATILKCMEEAATASLGTGAYHQTPRRQQQQQLALLL
jgi:hypothetical protein